MRSPLHFRSLSVTLALLASVAAVLPVRAAQPLTYDRISFSVSAERQVPADQVVAVMAAQRQGSRAADLAGEVNALAAWGLEQAKGVSVVEAQTLSYETTPVYTKGSLSGWRVTQTIKLRSTDATALSELVGRLQEKLLLLSVDYGLSEQRRDAEEAGLIRKSLDAFKNRARLIAEGMGQPRYRAVEMRVDTGGRTPSPLLRSSAGFAAAQAPAPVPPSLGAGLQSLRVEVSGVIELQAQ